MTVLDAPLRRAAKTILAKFGKPVTVTLRDATGQYNAMLGQQGRTSTTISTFALETPVSGGFSPQKVQGDQAGSVRTDTKWLLPALDFPTRSPRLDDIVAFGTQEFRVLEGVAHETGELAGLYEVRIGR